MQTIKITYGGETAILTCDMTSASAPLRVDGDATPYQTADARHRVPLAVALACRTVWPEADWPVIPAIGSVDPDAVLVGEAWDEMEYETLGDLVLCESADGWSLHAPGSSDEDISSGDAPYLASGTGEPTEADYERARAALAARG